MHHAFVGAVMALGLWGPSGCAPSVATHDACAEARENLSAAHADRDAVVHGLTARSPFVAEQVPRVMRAMDWSAQQLRHILDSTCQERKPDPRVLACVRHATAFRRTFATTVHQLDDRGVARVSNGLAPLYRIAEGCSFEDALLRYADDTVAHHENALLEQAVHAIELHAAMAAVTQREAMSDMLAALFESHGRANRAPLRLQVEVAAMRLLDDILFDEPDEVYLEHKAQHENLKNKLRATGASVELSDSYGPMTSVIGAVSTREAGYDTFAVDIAVRTVSGREDDLPEHVLRVFHERIERYLDEPDPSRAIPLAQAALDIARKHLGPSTIFAANTAVDLAFMLPPSEGAKRLALIQDALAIHLRVLGAHHITTLQDRMLAGGLALQVRDYDTAMTTLEPLSTDGADVMDARRIWLTGQSLLAHALIGKGRYSEALEHIAPHEAELRLEGDLTARVQHLDRLAATLALNGQCRRVPELHREIRKLGFKPSPIRCAPRNKPTPGSTVPSPIPSAWLNTGVRPA